VLSAFGLFPLNNSPAMDSIFHGKVLTAKEGRSENGEGNWEEGGGMGGAMNGHNGDGDSSRNWGEKGLVFGWGHLHH
jgi:hypothetical protein